MRRNGDLKKILRIVTSLVRVLKTRRKVVMIKMKITTITKLYWSPMIPLPKSRKRITMMMMKIMYGGFLSLQLQISK